MKRLLFFVMMVLASPCIWADEVAKEQPVIDLVNRVCGSEASANFTFTLDEEWNDRAEAFQLGSADGKVTVKANTMSALTCGLNWYLNHEAHVNIAWNNLTQTPASYPAPNDTQTHTAKGKYRYYLNYCTFSYSMSFWDEDRWMKEIDWMALHGVNLPLQIVGMDAVWYYMLREQFGFSHDEASEFVAGPAFQGWWLMNNLTGHGGKNPEWWYARQAELGRKITDRMRELGMAPCLPGYVGMAPQKYVTDTGATSYTGGWCGFTCPLLIAPGDAYTNMATQYYAYIEKVFGFMPTSFSIDPAHERDVPSGMDYTAACNAARNAMNAASPNALWVAQEWQVNATQSRIDALPTENTLLLDLSSERVTYTNSGYNNSGSGYGSHEYLFCMLHNYGGNVGMYGCMMQMLSNYSAHLTSGAANGTNGTLMGVGATPEGIETNPMLYDLLFELPWLSTVPTAEQWLADYTVSRYGTDDANAKAAWENLRTTVYANTNSGQQGCREPVFCARPNLSGNGASSWAGATYNWDKNKVIEAAEKLLAANGSGTNYEYDVVDFVRQAITDYAHTLQMDMAGQAPQGARFAEQANGFLGMMDDVDELLGTLPDFRMGKWAGAARQIAADAGKPGDANWLEANARLLVTSWALKGWSVNEAGGGGLHDYGNREWQGLVKDYYKPRWVKYFDDMKRQGSCSMSRLDWVSQYEWPYIYGGAIGTAMSQPGADLYVDAAGINYMQSYSAVPVGDPFTVASAKFAKYFGRLSNGKYYSPYVETDASDITIPVQTVDDLNALFAAKTTGSYIVSYHFDVSDGMATATVPARVKMSDGALITFKADLRQGLPMQPAANGEMWPDVDGRHINAHGGMIMRVDTLWYWWGEDRPYHGFTTEVGVSVYTSPDLKTWTRRGTALSVSEEAGSDIERGCIMERPKVVRSATTGQWVMLFHLELKGRGYDAARVGFAVADRPEGPYRFVRSLRPNAGLWPADFTEADIQMALALDEAKYKEWWTPQWRKAVEQGLILRRDVPGGQMSRDMTVFVDDDGTAYHIFSAEENLTLNIAQLTPDCLDYTGRYVRVAPGGQNEAPTIFKRGGTYWLITSGCTGWAPNKARMFSAPSIWGPWTQHDTPFVGEGADTSFDSQGTYVFCDGSRLLFMADVWNPRHLSQSRHLWLPIGFDAQGVPVIK